MIKVKDGYGKLIGTTYQGSATQVLLSNGGNLEFSSGTKANTLVQRNASQHIYATYFNSAISDEALTDIGSVYVRNTSDTFIRRISKTQFYSIIDNKFVTLDTAQTITGVKTFSTGPILAINATITQNQNSTSNYTTVIKWLKGGTSQGTYNPSIGQHNTGGDGTGSICILPYPTETSPWNGTVGLFISKGVLRLDGKAVAIADNYYTKTESDNRYVNVTGDTMTGPLIVKASITGTQLISNIANGTAPLKVTSKTVVTNLNSDLLDGYHETSFFRARGSQTIAGSIPTTTELSSNNNLSGNWNVSFPGASGHLVQFNTGSGSTRYMQFYSHYSGSLYWRNSTDSTLSTKSWKTIVDSANYTGIVLKIGTATKGSATLPIYLNAGTPTACSTTLGVSITGNAATATKLQTARTINGTSFNGTANITTAYWGATRTITLSGAVTGSASVNGSQNVTITTTYQTGSIDGRYVGGKKTAGHGSQGTAYTADTYSSNFVNKAFVAYAERGSWAYANNGYITTNTGVNIPLAGTAIFQWGASDTNKTQLFITPHNNSGVSNPATNEMLFYTSNGSGYTSAWTRVLTHRNYTTYTVTKTGGGASGTWGISITGNAATATTAQYLASNSRMDYGWNGLNYFNINGTAGTAVKANNTPTTAWWHILRFNHANSSGYYTDLAVPFNANSLYYKRVAAGALVNGKWVRILDELNYTSYVNPANFVTSLGTNGNYVTWTKNGTTNNLTVPYASYAGYLQSHDTRSVNNTPGQFSSGARFQFKQNSVDGLNNGGTYHGILHFKPYGGTTDFSRGQTHQLGFTDSGNLYMRTSTSSTAWGSWKLILNQNTADGRYVTLTTNQTVSGIKTFSKQQKFTVATGTSPFTVSSTTVVSNLNADMLDGWHLSYILKDGYVTSGTAGLSSYWRKVWDITLNNQYNDVDINLLVHSAYNQQWGIISFRLRQNGTGTAKNISAYLAEVVGNIPLDRFRLYYNNSSGLCQLWCNPSGQYNVYNYRVLAKTWRTGTEATTLGTFYTGNTTTAQSLPSDSYVSMTGITIVNTAAKVANTLTFSAGKFSSKTYNGGAAVTVNIPTNTSHLTNDSGFWTGTRYWANIAVSTSSSSTTSPTFSNVYLGSHLYLNNKGSNSIYNGPNDAANGVGGALNNLVFSSWFGVSFTTSCSGQTYTNKNAVSINCRTGLLSANTLSGNRAYIGGYNNTSYALSTSSFICNSWVRSVGSTGWYSQTYGGGIYMTDTTYVRVYNGKRFYASGGYLAPYTGSSWISMATRTNCIVADQNNSASSAHALFRVKNSSGHAIAFGGLGANIGFYGFYASRISSGSNGTDWSTVWNAGTGVITHSKTIYTAGYYHSSVNSNNYVLLAGGSYKNLADFAKGNAGSSTQGVYVTGGTVKAMTYKLNATVNSGSSGKLAYYSGTNSIDDYTSTKGSSSTPIYLNAGVPTACSGVIVKYWGWYNINCYSGTTPSYSKKGGNFNFVTSISRRSEGKYTLGTVYPSGYTWNNTIYWGSGRLNKGMSSNSSNSVLYVTMLNGYQSGSTRYLYVNTADDSSTNDGNFDVFFLCF